MLTYIQNQNCNWWHVKWHSFTRICDVGSKSLALTKEVNFAIYLWLGPPWFNYWFSSTLTLSRISHEYLPLFTIVINLIFIFSLWCIDWVGSLLCEPNLLCISVLRVASGPPRVGRKSALNPLVVYSTVRSKAMVPVLVLLFVAVWFIIRGDLF